MEAIILLLKEYGIIAAGVAGAIALLKVGYDTLKKKAADSETKVDDILLEEIEKEVKDQIEKNQ
jgi:hypothetical protein